MIQVSKTDTKTLNRQWIYWYGMACKSWSYTEACRSLMDGELALERKKDVLFHALLEKDKAKNPINESYLKNTISGDLAEVKNHILDDFYSHVLKEYKSPPSGVQDLEEYDGQYLKKFNQHIKKRSQLPDYANKREKKSQKSQPQSDIDEMVKFETFHIPVLCWFGNFTRDGSWLFVTNASANNKITAVDKSSLPKGNTGRSAVLANDKEVIAATNRTASPSVLSFTSCNSNSTFSNKKNYQQVSTANQIGSHVETFLHKQLVIEQKKARSFAETNRSTILRNAIDGCTDSTMKIRMQQELQKLALHMLNNDLGIKVTGTDDDDDDNYKIAAVPVETVSKVLTTNKVIDKVDASYIDDNFKGSLNKYNMAVLC